MKIEVFITDQPLHLDPVRMEECGAVARFDGIVRATEKGQSIEGLAYEAYQPMAETIIQRLLTALYEEHPFELARVQHRIGWVPVGAAAIILEVHTKHRAEGLEVLRKFMDGLKQDVPIWKTERSATFRGASENKPGQDARTP